MKKEKMLRAMELIDDVYVDEANPEPMKKRNRQARKKLFIGFAGGLAVAAAVLWLVVPFRTTPPSVARYSGSEYYEVIRKLNEVTYEKPEHSNNFEKYIGHLLAEVRDDYNKSETSEAPAESDGNPNTGQLTFGGQSYEEITDNQVAGVIEADLIKRSDKYIYYLSGDTLHVYSIEGEASAEVGTYTVTNEKMLFGYPEEWELYLSEDCRTVTVVAAFANADRESCVGAIALDVTDPANITEKGMTTVSGGYLSSRYTDGDILLMTQFRVRSDPDFSDESNYLPQIDTGSGMQSIPAEKIILPEELNNSRYVVVCKLDGVSLEVKDYAAFLSYSEDFYVSEDNIFATRVVSDTKIEEIESGTRKSYKSVTEIVGLSYSGETLESLGSITVDGYIKDQYSLDEYEGILRVVTTTDLRVFTEQTEGGYAKTREAQGGTSASLYCISLDEWQIVAEVAEFAPKNETVQSVRFDGTAAYVCTAIQLSDPVFFFDLSDLDHITYKETGTIAGYSTSLINFGDGFLLGIGVGANWNSLKLEVYEESETGVVSVCQYMKNNTEFSDDYKAYYVDRENQLVGLGVRTEMQQENHWEMVERYLLLFFDGYKLRELLDVELPGDADLKRAVYIDGYFYMFGDDAFAVEKIGSEANSPFELWVPIPSPRRTEPWLGSMHSIRF